MRDRNPAVKSKVCPKCGGLSFRLGIHTQLIRHYGCYCRECGYRTKLSPSENIGCKPWMEADDNDVPT